jgi:hypothetical protein
VNQEPERKKVFFILGKQPGPSRLRFGLEQWQDWYQCMRHTACKAREHVDPRIILASGVKYGKGNEADFYAEYLTKHFNVPLGSITIIRSGLDSISQINLAWQHAGSIGRELVIVAGFPHSLRVKRICIENGIDQDFSIETVFGLPRTLDACVDLGLALCWPTLSRLGIGQRLSRYVCKYRAKAL